MKYSLKRISIFIWGRFLMYRQRYFYPIIDRLHSTKLKVSIGDLMLLRGEISQIQFLVASRLLDIEEHENSSNIVSNFRFQHAISMHNSGTKYVSDDSFDRRFSSLIASYSKNGYDNDSYLFVDNRFTLENGTHRLAMHLYMNIPYINAEYHYRKCTHQDGLYSYYKKSYDILSTEIIKEVIVKYNKIQQWLIDEGQTFACLVCSSKLSEIENFINDMSVLVCVLRVKEIFQKERIYHLLDNFKQDDFKQKDLKSYLIQFRLSSPQYMVSGDTYFSKTVKNIDSVLNDRYPDRENIKYVISANCSEGYEIYRAIFAKT